MIEWIKRLYKKDDCGENFSYTSKEVSDDKCAFDITVRHSNGKSIEFRVLTFGEIKE